MDLRGTLQFASDELVLRDGAANQTTLKINGTSTNQVTLTLPPVSASDVLVGEASTQTLTNKRLTSPKINEDVALTTTATKLNYLTSATGTTGTASTNIVFSTSPTLVTPVLGVATATSINKVTLTAPAAGATLTIADGKVLTVSNTLTFTGTDTSSVAFGTGGTVAYTGGTLAQFAATTSAELAGVVSDETGSGALVFATSPTLVTPVLGVAAATTINKVTLTAPAAGSTLTIADGKTLTASNTLTFTGTDASSVAFGTGGTVAYTANKLSAFAATTSAELAGVISDETGTGALVLASAPALTSPTITTNLDMLAGAETRYYDADASNYVGFKAPALAANKIWTLPTADGSADQIMKTDGAGALGWATGATVVTTTRGDIIYRAAATDARLAIGSKGKPLRAGTNDPEWTWSNLSALTDAAIVYTITDTDGFETFLLTFSTNTARTITLPAVANNTGRRITFRRLESGGSGTGILTIDTPGAETIDGNAQFKLYSPNDWVTLLSDGTNWHVVGGNSTTAWVAYTPTLTTSGDNTAITLNATGKQDITGFWRRNGGSMEVSFSFRNGTAGAATGTAGNIQMSLPTGYTINTSARTSNTTLNYYVGHVGFMDGTNYEKTFQAALSTGTTPPHIRVRKGATLTNLSVSDLVASAALTCDVSFPVTEFAHFR